MNSFESHFLSIEEFRFSLVVLIIIMNPNSNDFFPPAEAVLYQLCRYFCFRQFCQHQNICKTIFLTYLDVLTFSFIYYTFHQSQNKNPNSINFAFTYKRSVGEKIGFGPENRFHSSQKALRNA